MTWQEAKQIAEEWAKQHLPPDLRGHKVELVSFECDEDTRYFYPERSEADHRTITTAVSRIARGRRGKTMYFKASPVEYLAICEKEGIIDSPEERAAYIQACHRVIEIKPS